MNQINFFILEYKNELIIKKETEHEIGMPGAKRT